MALPKHDLTGRKFGELTVIRKDTPYRTPSGIPFARWVCRCKCGKTKSIRATHLLNGKTKSCGCLKQAYLTTTKRKMNEYVVLDEYTKVFVSSSEYFLIDTDDIDKIKDLYWSFDSAGYAINVKTKKRLHTFLTNCPEGMCVDHISGDIKDNRRRNLRICTSQQNSWNKHKSPNNKTGVIGVHRNAKGKYIAQIRVNKHMYHLGTFNSLEDAADARRKAEQKYFGEFSGSWLNEESEE